MEVRSLVVIGLIRGPFTPTSDLDIKFLQSSFAAAEPIFGGFQAANAANFGFAILSDIEVFFLIQASKGDHAYQHHAGTDRDDVQWSKCERH